MSEVLNIDWHTRNMTVAALNKCNGNRKDAAEMLGVNERSIYRWISIYNIFRDPKTRRYFYTEGYVDDVVLETKNKFAGITNAETVE